MSKRTFLLAGALLTITFAAMPPPPSNQYSIAEGDFTTITNWSTDDHDKATCLCAPACTIGNNENVFIAHAMTTVCDPFTVSGTGELTIRNGGSLSLPANSELIGNGDITVDAGGTLYVNGDLDVSGNGNVTVNGDVIVAGDVSTAGSGSICGTGELTYGGSLSGSGVCNSLTTTFVAELPVSMLYFNVDEHDSGVELLWATASETNNDRFEVERSLNGLTFETIGEVTGAGNSTSTVNYSFVDDNPHAGTSYYRLLQVDFDGASEYSDTKSVSVGGVLLGQCELSVRPNPCTGNCRVVLSDCPQNVAQMIGIRMFDASGNMVDSYFPERDGDGGFSFHLEKTSNLKPGVYFIAGKSEQEDYSTRVIVN